MQLVAANFPCPADDYTLGCRWACNLLQSQKLAVCAYPAHFLQALASILKGDSNIPQRHPPSLLQIYTGAFCQSGRVLDVQMGGLLGGRPQEPHSNTPLSFLQSWTVALWACTSVQTIVKAVVRCQSN